MVRLIEGYHTDELFKFHPKISSDCQVGRFFKEILCEHLDEVIQAMAEKLSKVSLAQLLAGWQESNQ